MHAGSESLAAPSSFTARRPAATNLPGAFELPPPNLVQKYAGFAPVHSSQHSMNATGSGAGVGNLLTPPTTLHGDYNPLSPSTHSSGSGSAATAQSYAGNGYWNQQQQQQQQPPSAQYGAYGGAQSTPQQQQQQHQPWIPPRGMFNSPSSLNGMVQDSKAAGQPPGQDMYQLPPFGQSSVSMSAPPAMASVPQAATASPASQQEPFHMRSNSASSSYYQSNHTGVPHFSSGPSSAPQSHARMSPLSASHDSQGLYGSAHGSQPYQRPYSQYGMSAVGNPVMSSMHNGANGQMGMVSGMSHGMMGSYGGVSQHMYGMQHHGQAQTPANDRPFKCDQCMQSFNRNHDLKRHKRIHLAVKPYPCGHCDKSFSRKDALKRHILVKGCGKALTGEDNDDKASDSSTSPVSTKSGGAESHMDSGLRR